MGDHLFYFQLDHHRRCCRHHQAEEQEAMGEEEHEQQQLEAEEALSLSDLPLDDHPTSVDPPSHSTTDDLSALPAAPRSSSQPQDLFEFFPDHLITSDDHIMCSADDIIICGKLVPSFKQPTYRSTNPHNPFAELEKRDAGVDEERRQQQSINYKATLGLRSRSESSCNPHSSTTSKTKLTRNSRSLDYRKLMSNSPEMAGVNSSIKCLGKSADHVLSAKRSTRPRWSALMFGMVRFPAEMELEDIKTRQLRRNPTTLFIPTTKTVAATSGGINPLVSRNKGSWKLLKALSCKDHTSVAITTPLAPCLPQNESFA